MTTSQTPPPATPQTFAGLGSLDVGRLDDVVSAVWDHKDEVGTAVTFVRDHGDDLVRLASQLPDLLAQAATALTEAAGDTRATARFLTGEGTPDGGVKHLADLAGDALETCRGELDDVRSLLVKAADLLGRLPMMDDVAGSLRDGVAHFDGAGAQLAAVAQSLRGIGSLVDGAGQGLARTADKLDGGASALGTFTRG